MQRRCRKTEQHTKATRRSVVTRLTVVSSDDFLLRVAMLSHLVRGSLPQRQRQVQCPGLALLLFRVGPLVRSLDRGPGTRLRLAEHQEQSVCESDEVRTGVDGGGQEDTNLFTKLEGRHATKHWRCCAEPSATERATSTRQSFPATPACQQPASAQTDTEFTAD